MSIMEQTLFPFSFFQLHESGKSIQPEYRVVRQKAETIGPELKLHYKWYL
jgi:hypothetical protein